MSYHNCPILLVVARLRMAVVFEAELPQAGAGRDGRLI